MDGDQVPDLVVANQSSDNVSVLLGVGDGTFGAAVNYPAGSGPSSVAIGDLDGDRVPDLAIASLYSGGTVSVLLGLGDGTFAAAVNYPAGRLPSFVAIGDLDGDQVPDLAVANWGSDNVSVLLGVGDGTFATAVHYAVGDSPNSVAIDDLDGDNAPDLAVANGAGGNVSVLLGFGDGTFAAALYYAAAGGPTSVAISDLDGDQTPDMALANFVANGGAVSVLLNQRRPAPPPLRLLLVSGKETDSVLAYDGVSGTFFRELIPSGAHGLDYPNGIITDSAGNAYVSSVGSDSVLKVAVPGGELIREYSSGALNGPVGLLIQDSSLLVASWATDSVEMFDLESGTWLGTFVARGSGGLDGPADLIRAANGNVLVASQRTNQILEFDAASGAFVRVAAAGGGLDRPAGMVHGAAGNLLVASFGAGAVLEYAPDGSFLGEFVAAGSGGLIARIAAPNRSQTKRFPFGPHARPSAYLVFATTKSRGDLNCDGAFNGGDIDPFFLALGDPEAYVIAFPNCDPLLGDTSVTPQCR